MAVVRCPLYMECFVGCGYTPSTGGYAPGTDAYTPVTDAYTPGTENYRY